MMASGKESMMPWLPYVVGVCSLEERPSESSESLARTGELLCTLLSYSSSASDSGYAVPDSNAIIILQEQNGNVAQNRAKGFVAAIQTKFLTRIVGADEVA